jgi:hypothetical protein
MHFGATSPRTKWPGEERRRGGLVGSDRSREAGKADFRQRLCMNAKALVEAVREGGR